MLLLCFPAGRQGNITPGMTEYSSRVGVARQTDLITYDITAGPFSYIRRRSVHHGSPYFLAGISELFLFKLFFIFTVLFLFLFD